jgi:hypothetical protein
MVGGIGALGEIRTPDPQIRSLWFQPSARMPSGDCAAEIEPFATPCYHMFPLV